MTGIPETITAIGTLVAAIGALVISWNNRRATADAREKAAVAAAAALAGRRDIVATREGVFELGKQIDGRLSELLAITKSSAYAEGRLEGAASERDRT